MRLIDAGAFEEFIEKVYRPLCDDYNMKDYVLNQLLHDIENEPGVEAIPVEWLLNHIPKDEVMQRYNEKLIEYLVIGWRKENETIKV